MKDALRDALQISLHILMCYIALRAVQWMFPSVAILSWIASPWGALVVLFLWTSDCLQNREHPVWARLRALIVGEHRIVYENPDAPRYCGGPAVFACTPHGILALGTIATFLLPGTFSVFARSRIATSRLFMRIPLLNWLFRLLGCVDATAEAMGEVLKNGEALVLIPEGHRGQVAALYGRTLQFSAERMSTGFLYMAWDMRVPVYPVFHDTEIHRGAWIRRVRWVKRVYLWFLRPWSTEYQKLDEAFATRLAARAISGGEGPDGTRSLTEDEKCLGFGVIPRPKHNASSPLVTRIGVAINPREYDDFESFTRAYFAALPRLIFLQEPATT